MILEIDAGNTRAKWRVRHLPGQSEAIVTSKCYAVNIVAEAGRAADLLCESFDALQWSRVEKIWVSNVRGHDFEEALTARLRDVSRVQVEFPKSAKCCAGVTNGYDQPETLGIDRWLAILAAYNSVMGPCCIVDCGTTITVDLVDGSGLHVGGYIVPGIALMKASLSRRSNALQSNDGPVMTIEPGRSTSSAINNGIHLMISGFVSHVIEHGPLNNPPASLVFTGGDGNVVKNCVAHPSVYKPFLVMDGLQLALSEMAQSLNLP